MHYIYEVQSHLHISGWRMNFHCLFQATPASSKEPFPKCFVPQFTKKEAMGTRADADLVSIGSYWASGFSWSCLCWEMTLRSWGQQGNIVYFSASEFLCNLSSKFWCPEETSVTVFPHFSAKSCFWFWDFFSFWTGKGLRSLLTAWAHRVVSKTKGSR